ncbi:MAG: DMT family transporter [Cyanobacteria bacterium P01_E01_bin.42]
MTNQTLVEKKNSFSRYFLGFVLLVGVSLIFGSVFPVIKAVGNNLSPQLLTTSRYAIAALVLSPLVFKSSRSLIQDGSIIGLLCFSVSFLSCTALEGISASRAGFTFALSIVFVTLWEIFSGRTLSVLTLICTTMAFSGIVLMSWYSGESFTGSIWMILAAILDSAYILIIERAVTIHSPLKLAAVSCWLPAILGLIWSASELTEKWGIVADNIWALLYLGIVAIAIVTVMEIVAQQWVSGNETAIFRTIEPLSATFFSFWFLGETFHFYDYLGSGMVLGGIVLLLLFKDRGIKYSQFLKNLFIFRYSFPSPQSKQFNR